MGSKNRTFLKKINLMLAVILIVLIINLIKPQLGDTIGYTFQSRYNSPRCTFFNNEMNSSIPIGLCCVELQKQLSCDKITNDNYNFKCYTSKSANYYYLINNAVKYYCKKEGYLVKTN